MRKGRNKGKVGEKNTKTKVEVGEKYPEQGGSRGKIYEWYRKQQKNRTKEKISCVCMC